MSDMISFKGRIAGSTLRSLEIKPAILASHGPPAPVAAASTAPISTESSQPSLQAPAALQVSERHQAVVTDIPAGGAIRDVPAPAAPALIHTATWSPSFNCAKAGNSAERLICSNKDLADADVRMASAYRQALASAKDKANSERSKTHGASTAVIYALIHHACSVRIKIASLNSRARNEDLP
jgi:hypothetical protein